MKAAFGHVCDIKHLSSQGVTRIVVEIPAEHHIDATQLLFGQNVMVLPSTLQGNYGIIDSNPSPSAPPAPSEEKPVSERSLAQKLHINGYFYNRKLWLALHTSGLYTLQDHKKFIESQACIAPKATSGMCEGDVCAHHCDTAAIEAAGSALQPENPQKPPHWYTVPICFAHHQKWAHGSHAKSATRSEKLFLNHQASELMAAQAKVEMKVFLGIDSMRELTAEMLERFEKRIGFA